MDGLSAGHLAELPSSWTWAPQAFTLGVDDVRGEGLVPDGWELL